MRDPDLDELEAELAEFAAPKDGTGLPVRDERLIAGFADIQEWVGNHGRRPLHGQDLDIFERLFAVRLERLIALPEARELLEPFDHQKLLASATGVAEPDHEISLDQLAAELASLSGDDDITNLRHVRTSANKRAAEEIADRKQCEDFKKFKPLFQRLEADLNTGLRLAQPIQAGQRTVEEGDFFVLDGVTLYIAEVGKPLKTTAGEVDRRLRAVFSNGTESNLLLRSLQRAFYSDPAARRLVVPESRQLSMSGVLEPDDVESGTIYVLRSLSDHPFVSKHRELVHKIGVTGGRVETRIANAENEATYLLAKVEIVATYTLAGVNRTRMESLFHKLFSSAQLNITINDRFGQPVQPREWFLLPRFVIDEAVERVMDGSIINYIYDPQVARLVSIQRR
jgi:hypothetical protein